MNDVKDVFISFKSDGRSNAFAEILSRTLKAMRYSVYYSEREKHSGAFPDDLAKSISHCKDFLMLATPGYLEDLVRPNAAERSWVRRELLLAKQTVGEDRIIRVNVDERVDSYNDALASDSELAFLTSKNDITMRVTDFEESPLHKLTEWMTSKPREENPYRLQSNGNKRYDVYADFERTLSAAEGGDARAMYEVANMYYYGFADNEGGTGRSFPMAFKWLKRLSETDSEYRPYALSMMGHMYYSGAAPRTGQSYAKSYELHSQSVCESGIGAAHLAWMESVGLGCEFDFDAAEKRFLDLASADNLAKNNLAKFYYDYGMFDKAAEQYRQIADVLPHAAHALGLMHMRGVLNNPPKPDFRKAEYYFQKAVSSSNCEAQVFHDLGHLYFRPTGDFPKDFKKALEYYEIAANRQNSDSQYMCGYIYTYNSSFRNYGKAIHYHTLAAEQGHPLSSNELAMLYQQPGHIDYAKAFAYAQQSANAGIASGAFNYANLLLFGRGCNANVDEAYRQYNYAYEHGLMQAKCMMDKIEEMDER